MKSEKNSSKEAMSKLHSLVDCYEEGGSLFSWKIHNLD